MIDPTRDTVKFPASVVEMERLRCRLAEQVRRGDRAEAALAGAQAAAEWLKREAAYDASRGGAGRSLRQQRLAADWTMGDVAWALGMSVSWVSDLELGHIACTPSIRRLYLEALRGERPPRPTPFPTATDAHAHPSCEDTW